MQGKASPSHVATLPWEIQKVASNSIIHTLQIIYVTAEKNNIYTDRRCKMFT